jgi:thiosulfate reductase cytochrome b subunit
MASFPTLVVTGFALKYPESWWAKPLLMWESSTGVRGGLHRTAAIAMIAAILFHFVHLALKRKDRSFVWAMIPTIEDASDMLHVFRFNLGFTKEEPQFAKFNYAEKMEYWAFMWGTMVMALSGFLLWFNNFTLRHFPKWVSDAATAVHWYEALLATFSILIWHFYLVIFDPMVYPMDTAWLVRRKNLRRPLPLHPASLLSSTRSRRPGRESRGSPSCGAPSGTSERR